MSKLVEKLMFLGSVFLLHPKEFIILRKYILIFRQSNKMSLITVSDVTRLFNSQKYKKGLKQMEREFKTCISHFSWEACVTCMII